MNKIYIRGRYVPLPFPLVNLERDDRVCKDSYVSRDASTHTQRRGRLLNPRAPKPDIDIFQVVSYPATTLRDNDLRLVY